jgi:DNA replication and repair protein RecF
MRDGKKEDFKQLDVWDHIFSEKSEILISKRVEFLSKFLYTFKHLYKCIAGDDTLNIFYSSSIDDYSKENIINVLLKTRRRDLQIGTTCIGPQRDDYVFGKTKESLFTNYCSQGQKRIASISLKMAEYEIVEKISGQKVVILVDDIFSELDENRRNHMVQLLTKGNQVIFTMANSFFGDYGNIMQSKKFLVETPGIVREL